MQICLFEKVSPVVHWIDGWLKWVIKPYLFWLGMESLFILTMIVVEITDKSFVQSTIREGAVNLGHVTPQFIQSYFYFVNVFLLLWLLIPLVAVFIGNIIYLIKEWRRRE
jgi:hypothetical protein